MSSCTDSVPYQFQAGGLCAGWGVCVNSTRTPGLLLCKCNSWNSGASDLFDNRVEQLPDGTWLSYSCNSSAIGTYVVWSIWLLSAVLRLIQLVPLWRNFWKKHYGDQKLTADGIWNDQPLRVVTEDLLATVPMLVTGFAKLAGMTIGTDALPTVTLVLFILGVQLAAYDLGNLEFNIFVQGSSNPVEARKAKRLRVVLRLGGTIVYLLMNAFITLWTLSLDKSKGPLVNGGNGEEVVIYVRNAAAIVFSISEIVTTWMIRQRVQMLRLVQGREDSAVAYIIKKMDTEIKTHLGRFGFAGIMVVVFSIPYLLPYQTYIIALALGLGLAKPVSKAFTSENEKQKAISSSRTPAASTRSLSSRDSTGKREAGKRESLNVPAALGKRDSVPSLLVPPSGLKRGSSTSTLSPGLEAQPSPVLAPSQPPEQELEIQIFLDAGGENPTTITVEDRSL